MGSCLSGCMCWAFPLCWLPPGKRRPKRNRAPLQKPKSPIRKRRKRKRTIPPFSKCSRRTGLARSSPISPPSPGWRPPPCGRVLAALRISRFEVDILMASSDAAKTAQAVGAALRSGLSRAGGADGADPHEKAPGDGDARIICLKRGGFLWKSGCI